MKVVVDMNVSPLCALALNAAGHGAQHWSEVGLPTASDVEIMAWALEHDSVVLTHDLDFGDILGASGAGGPSVIQLRAERLAVAEIAQLVASALRDCRAELNAGALITLDASRRRMRLLPINRPSGLAPDSESGT